MWGSKSRLPSVGLFGGRKILGPIFIMISCPVITILFALLLSGIASDRPVNFILRDISTGNLFSGHSFDFKRVSVVLGGFIALNILCLKFLPPTELTSGPVTPGGSFPEYASNGIQTLLVNLIIFVLFSDFGCMGFYEIDVWVRNLPELFILTNIFSFAFCLWIYRRNQIHKTLDYSTSGNTITDFYAGNELHPKFFGSIDVKQFTNCRFGMMLWPIMIISAAGCEFRRYGSLSGASSVAYLLQMLYLIKFFIWEQGYFFTLDMMHDRAGFYLCWGCINWVPCVYALVCIFHGLVSHDKDMNTLTMVISVILGVLALALNYHSDLQRKQFRESGNKAFYILRKRATFIIAKYKTEDGKTRSSKLLTSGYWGLCRHFNYLAELLFSYVVGSTTAYVGMKGYGLIFGMFYPLFLTILLIDRCYRDEARCLIKYGEAWKRYCEKVRFRLIPGIY